MHTTRLHLIAAVGTNRALGKDNKLLWRLPEDLRRFKQLTLGHPVIMGRKTFESIGKPLPNRTNIVITANPNFAAEGCTIVHSLNQGLSIAQALDKDVFVIGGGKIYAEALPYADILHLTIVNDNPEADTFFPDWSNFSQILSKEEGWDPLSKHTYTFLTLTKKETVSS